jgi:hypothetical protein
MTKTIIILTAMLSLAMSTHGGDFDDNQLMEHHDIRDSDGNQTGTMDGDGFGGYIIHDSNGNVTGRIEPDPLQSSAPNK